jgi:predicted RNA-binding Zn-ribbon protein involved in translation (DUF1610 family)
MTLRKKYGYMKCPDCGARVTVKINDLETLVYACDDCDGTGYSRKGEGRYAGWLAKIERCALPPPPVPDLRARPDPPSPAPASPPAPDVAKAPAKADDKMPWVR